MRLLKCPPNAYKVVPLLESRFGLFGASFFSMFVVHPFRKGDRIAFQGAQIYTNLEIETQLASDQDNCQEICVTTKYHRAHI